MRIWIVFLLSLCILPVGLGQVQDAWKIGQYWETDTSKKSVELSEFRALLRRDGIPPIDRPTYLERDAGERLYFKHEPVISLIIGDEARAYPLNILTYHEIVNDTVGGVPVSITYCPLCNAAIVFDRRLSFEGEDYVLDFGVSGMLRKSDLVMWDRQTESWWQQFVGEALVGELTGAQLSFIPAQIITVKQFFSSYPTGKILSQDTGLNSRKDRYGTNTYEGYDQKGQKPRLFKGKIDERLDAMERVVDVRIGNTYKIYPLTDIRKEHLIEDRIEGQAVVLFYQKGAVSVLDAYNIREAAIIGSVTVFDPVVNGDTLSFSQKGKYFLDKQTNSRWDITGKAIEGPLQGTELRKLPHGNHFAFAWLAFHPASLIYGQEEN